MDKFEKFRKQLGLDTSIKTAHVVKEVTKDNNLTFPDYLTLFQSLKQDAANTSASSTETTEFVVNIVNKIVELRKLLHKDRKKNRETNQRALHCLVNTLHFVALFYAHGVDAGDSKLAKAFKAFDDSIKSVAASPSVGAVAGGGGGGGHEAACAVMRDLRRQLQGSASQTAEPPSVNSLVTECYLVDSLETTLLEHGARRRDFSVLGEFPFVHLYLKRELSRGGVQAKTIFDAIRKLLKVMPGQLKAHPIMAGSMLGNTFALLHMLREYISLYPVADVGMLTELQPLVRLFKSWPLPYTEVASELDELLRREALSPGAALRSRLVEENLLLGPDAARLVAECGEQRVLQWVQSQRSAVVWLNWEVPRAKLFAELSSKVLGNTAELQAETRRTREESLTSILETRLGVPCAAGAAMEPIHDMEHLLQLGQSARLSSLVREGARSRVASDHDGDRLYANAWGRAVCALMVPRTLTGMQSEDFVLKWHARAVADSDPERIAQGHTAGDDLVKLLMEIEPACAHGVTPFPPCAAAAADEGGGEGGGAAAAAAAAAAAPDEHRWSHCVPALPKLELRFHKISTAMREGQPMSHEDAVRNRKGTLVLYSVPATHDVQLSPAGAKRLSLPCSSAAEGSAPPPPPPPPPESSPRKLPAPPVPLRCRPYVKYEKEYASRV